MPIYPGIAAAYSDAAWHRAQLMTDGRITDGLLAGCEAALAGGAEDWRHTPPRLTAQEIAQQRVTLLRNLLRTQRDAVWHAEREAEAPRNQCSAMQREFYANKVNQAQAELVRLDAELVDAELAMKEAV